MKPREGRADWPPGRSERTESSSVIYSRASLSRPARGWSEDGSAKVELFRKESTPCAEDGSKAGDEKFVVGSGFDGALLCCEELFLEDCPVSAFQMDAISGRRLMERREGNVENERDMQNRMLCFAGV